MAVASVQITTCTYSFF